MSPPLCHGSPIDTRWEETNRSSCCPERLSEDALQVGESSLYPALQRLLLKGWVKAEWGASENNRRARYYTLTPAGRKQLVVERQEFDRIIVAIHKVLNTA
jgi:PadR family transcriptional regulator PadR